MSRVILCAIFLYINLKAFSFSEEHQTAIFEETFEMCSKRVYTSPLFILCFKGLSSYHAMKMDHSLENKKFYNSLRFMAKQKCLSYEECYSVLYATSIADTDNFKSRMYRYKDYQTAEKSYEHLNGLYLKTIKNYEGAKNIFNNLCAQGSITACFNLLDVAIITGDRNLVHNIYYNKEDYMKDAIGRIENELFLKKFKDLISCDHSANSFNCVSYTSNYDGDTFTFSIPDIHPLFGKNAKIRLRGIDTAEIRTKDKCEKLIAMKAKKVARELLLGAKRIDLYNIRRGKYFRIVADIKFDGKDLKRQLLNKSLGYVYDGKAKKSLDWCSLIKIN